MILGLIFNILTYLSIIGFSFIFLKYILQKKIFYISNLDVFFGLFLLFICSVTINLFFIIDKIQPVIFIVGLYFFYVSYKSKILKINFISIFILILIFTFISLYSNNNADSPMYHLQILKYLIKDKAVFGLSNLEIRFGANSSWHSIIAILNVNFLEFSSKHYLSAILIAVGLNEVFEHKKDKIQFSYLFLNIAFIILILFSLIHPNKNGVILNHLGNAELDIAPMIFFILSIYVLIKFYTDKKNENLFYLYCVLSFMCITSRLVYAPLLLPILINLFESPKIITKKNIILLFGSFLWFLKSFINSGCLIFPHKFTCIETSWSPSIEKIDYFLKEVMSFAKDTPLRAKYTDFDYTLKSMDWFMPWYEQYFLVNALLSIVTMIMAISLILIFYYWIIKKFDNQKFIITKDNKIILLILFFSLLIWSLAPEIRLGWGVLIALPAFIFCYSISLNFENFIKKNFIFKSLLIFQTLLILGLFSKSFDKFNHKDLFVVDTKGFNYSRVKELGIYDNYKVYIADDQQCYEFPEFCVNRPRKNYTIKEIYGYKIINGK